MVDQRTEVPDMRRMTDETMGIVDKLHRHNAYLCGRLNSTIDWLEEEIKRLETENRDDAGWIPAYRKVLEVIQED
jgi:hypothetical protein